MNASKKPVGGDQEPEGFVLPIKTKKPSAPVPEPSPLDPEGDPVYPPTWSSSVTKVKLDNSGATSVKELAEKALNNPPPIETFSDNPKPTLEIEKCAYVPAYKATVTIPEHHLSALIHHSMVQYEGPKLFWEKVEVAIEGIVKGLEQDLKEILEDAKKGGYPGID